MKQRNPSSSPQLTTFQKARSIQFMQPQIIFLVIHFHIASFVSNDLCQWGTCFGHFCSLFLTLIIILDTGTHSDAPCYKISFLFPLSPNAHLGSLFSRTLKVCSSSQVLKFHHFTLSLPFLVFPIPSRCIERHSNINIIICFYV
jgi:hypothetical protein